MLFNFLRKTDKKVLLVVNKTDNTKLLEEMVEFYNLGIGEYYPISSISGSGTGELLEELGSHFQDKSEMEDLDILNCNYWKT